MTIGVGVRSYIGLGEEAVYGTAVARDVFVLHNSESVKNEEEKLQGDEIYRAGLNSDARGQGARRVSGDFSWNPRYSARALTRLLKHALGSIATARPDITSDPTVYRHTATPADDLPVGLTVEVCKDLDSHLFQGCKVSRLGFSWAAGQKMECSVGLVGQQGSNLDLPTALVWTEGNLIRGGVECTVVLAGTTYKVTAADISIENALEPIIISSSRVPQDYVRSGKRTITGTFRAYFEDATLFSRFLASQRGTLTLTFTGSAATANFNYDLVFTASVTELTDATVPADKSGPIEVNCAFQCFLDGANANEVSVRVTNTNSAA